MKKLHFYYFIIISIFISCDALDTYDEPKETLIGEVIDSTTGKPIVTEQPNGYRLKLMEYSWSDNPLPLYFWGKADGTFSNTKIFKGTYGIKPVEGAFFEPEEQTIKIKGTAQVTFTVTPYLTVSASRIELRESVLYVEYNIYREKVGDKILDSRVFVSTNPNVGFNILTDQLSPSCDLKDTDDEEILRTTYREEISGLEKGKTYYVRVGARTNNPSLRYNFTETIEIKN